MEKNKESGKLSDKLPKLAKNVLPGSIVDEVDFYHG